MAHSKKANAMVTHPRVSGRGWDGLRKVATSGKSVNFTDQAREILGGSLDPDKYLFTHCTIVASVDTEKVSGIKLGKVKVGSSTVDRRYADYHIKPDCAQFVNNNGDSWSRPVLLASYPTFIGAHNFQEHVQVEEKSKGRIIDAVARDIGDSVYVDILVATARKHAQLIKDIESGKMGTLSMGCVANFTICSQCGHYAVDETELCDCIKYSKLNTFLDDEGKKRVTAELCGHKDADETGGVKFIEASWVAVPAFPGAVMRNIMKVGELQYTESEIMKVLASPAPSWSEFAISKAASSSRKALDFGDSEESAPPEPEKPAEPEKPLPFKDIEDSLYDMMKDRVRDRIEKEIKQKNEALPASVGPNDSIIKESKTIQTPAQSPRILVTSSEDGVKTAAEKVKYEKLVKNLVRVASSDAAIVDGFATINQTFGVRVSADVYRSALKAGPIHLHSDPQAFLHVCKKAAGRELSPAELRVVVRVGTLLSRWESIRNNNPAVQSSLKRSL